MGERDDRGALKRDVKKGQTRSLGCALAEPRDRRGVGGEPCVRVRLSEPVSLSLLRPADLS